MKKLILIIMFLFLVSYVNAGAYVCDYDYKNRTSSTGTYQVRTPIWCGVGGGGGGGGEGSSADNPVTVHIGESIEAGTLSNQLIYLNMAESSTVTFTSLMESHWIYIIKIEDDNIKFKTDNNELVYNLPIGKFNKFEIDLDKDGLEDIEIALILIDNNKADLTIKGLGIETIDLGVLMTIKNDEDWDKYERKSFEIKKSSTILFSFENQTDSYYKFYVKKFINNSLDKIKISFGEGYDYDLTVNGKTNVIHFRSINKTLNIEAYYYLENDESAKLRIWVTEYAPEKRGQRKVLWTIFILIGVVAVIWYLGRKK